MSYIALSSDGSQYEDYAVQTTEDQRELDLYHMYDNIQSHDEDPLDNHLDTKKYIFNGVIYD